MPHEIKVVEKMTAEARDVAGFFQVCRALGKGWSLLPCLLILIWAPYSPCQEAGLGSARVEYRWGLALQDRGDIDGALKAYSAAIQMEPRLAEAYNDRGNALLAKGEIEKALADFGHAIQIRRRFAEAYNNRGVARLFKGELAGAGEDFSKAIKSKADFAEAYGNRGSVRLHSGDPRGALRDFDKAVRLFQKPFADSRRIAVHDSRLVKALINRGVAHFALDDFDGAIADFDHAIEIDGQSAEALYDRRMAQDRKVDLAGGKASIEVRNH